MIEFGVKDTKNIDSNKAKTTKCIFNFVVYTILYTFATTMKKLRTIEMQRLSVDEFKQAEKVPLIVVLDDVRSMHNVGSVFRTGDAFHLKRVNDMQLS